MGLLDRAVSNAKRAVPPPVRNWAHRILPFIDAAALPVPTPPAAATSLNGNAAPNAGAAVLPGDPAAPPPGRGWRAAAVQTRPAPADVGAQPLARRGAPIPTTASATFAPAAAAVRARSTSRSDAPALPQGLDSAPNNAATPKVDDLRRQTDELRTQTDRRQADLARVAAAWATLAAEVGVDDALQAPARADSGPDAVERFMAARLAVDGRRREIEATQRSLAGDTPNADLLAVVGRLAVQVGQAQKRLGASTVEGIALKTLVHDLTAVAADLRQSAAAAEAKRDELDAAIEAIMDSRDQQVSANRLASPAYATAEQAYGQAAANARDRVAADQAFDQEALASPPPRVTARQMATYDGAREIGASLATRSGLALHGEELKKVCEAARADVKRVFAEQPFGDVTVDLACQTKQQLIDAMVAGLGMGAFAELAGTRRVAIRSIAQAMHEEVIASNPSQMKADRSELRIGKKTYVRQVELGTGAAGTASRYVNVDDASDSVVVKSVHDVEPGSAEYKEIMQLDLMNEIRELQRAKGPDGKGHLNLMALRGVALSPDGEVHNIIEDCAGGDAQQLSAAMRDAVAAGALTPVARNALVRSLFTDAARGLQQMADLGISHNDLKPDNIMIAADGKAKVGDLSASRATDAAGFAVTPASGASGYANFKEKKSLRHDVFSLGAFLNAIDAPDRRDKHNWPDFKHTSGHGETALDRLRNAMLSKNPADRPSLDAVLASSYVDELRGEWTDGAQVINADAVDALKKAMAGLSICAAHKKRAEAKLAEAQAANDTAAAAACQARLKTLDAQRQAALAETAAASASVTGRSR